MTMTSFPVSIQEILGLCIGAYLFFYGFIEIRKKRFIESIPTSKIRSVAMGLCEIAGTAKEKVLLKSPLTNTECVYYRFLVEKEVSDSKGNRSWRTVKKGSSTNYFYVEDGTGNILVDPLGAEMMLIKDYRNIEKKGIFAPKMRYTEWYIKPGDYTYVLGTVKKFKDAEQEHKEKLLARIRELKEDKDKLMQFDADKDGQISVEEWDTARQALEQTLIEEELKNPQAGGDDLVMAKGDAEKTFIVADRDERDLARHYSWKSTGFVVGGGLLIVVMLALILKG